LTSKELTNKYVDVAIVPWLHSSQYLLDHTHGKVLSRKQRCDQALGRPALQLIKKEEE